MARVIVVYGGGFQPFHNGHLSSYLEAKQAFPNADFYVVASADVKQRPIPFEDKRFLATQAGVNPKDFRDVAVKNPLNPAEILSHYDPEQDIYILVRSERDPVPYTRKDGSPAYYQPFVKGGKFQPFGKHGYVFVTKKKDFKLLGQDVYSGTQVRNMYSQANDQQRQEMVREMYPRSKQQNTIKKMLDKYIGKPAMNENIINLIKQARPLLAEASLEQREKFAKLIDEAIKQRLSVEEDWQKVNKSDKTDGMSTKAVKAYRRENPGSKLKTAVTTKPSKLKKGSKDANRRKSFCARMSGMKKAHASAKTKRDPDSPINKALRRWNCESIEELENLVMIAEQKLAESKSKAIGHTAKDLSNPDAGRLAKIQHNKELRRDEIERRSHEARANRKYSSTRDEQNKVKDGVEIRESLDYIEEK